MAFFALLYFAALRPSEALCDQDCELPADGWGKLILSTSEPQAGKAWTDDGKSRQERGLKWRAKNETRVVPIPPELVAMLRTHIETYGVGSGGRLFRTSSGGPIGSSAYWLVWEQARKLAYRRRGRNRHLPGGRTTCGTRVSRYGPTPASLLPRSPDEPGTALMSCSRSTPVASTATNEQPTNE
jgi:hypothetical protein